MFFCVCLPSAWDICLSVLVVWCNCVHDELVSHCVFTMALSRCLGTLFFKMRSCIWEVLDMTPLDSTFTWSLTSENKKKEWCRQLSVSCKPLHFGLNQLLNHSSAQIQSSRSDYFRDKMSHNNYVLWGERVYAGPLCSNKRSNCFFLWAEAWNRHGLSYEVSIVSGVVKRLVEKKNVSKLPFTSEKLSWTPQPKPNTKKNLSVACLCYTLFVRHLLPTGLNSPFLIY